MVSCFTMASSMLVVRGSYISRLCLVSCFHGKSSSMFTIWQTHADFKDAWLWPPRLLVDYGLLSVGKFIYVQKDDGNDRLIIYVHRNLF
jgi:hypothetical protein